jgi:TPR repeat protein
MNIKQLLIATILLLSSGAYGQPDFEETKLLAEQGNANAQNNLGSMYANGEGVPQNNIRAYVWFSVAAAQGNEIARDSRNRVSEGLTPTQLGQAQQIATKCFESDYQDCE